MNEIKSLSYDDSDCHNSKGTFCCEVYPLKIPLTVYFKVKNNNL